VSAGVTSRDPSSSCAGTLSPAGSAPVQAHAAADGVLRQHTKFHVISQTVADTHRNFYDFQGGGHRHLGFQKFEILTTSTL